MNKKLLSIVGICLLIIVSLSACGAKPDEIALQLAEATNAQDLEGALALFADDAVVTSVSPEPFNGKAEIQGWLEQMFADNFQLEAEIVEVNGDVVVEHDTMTMDSMSFFGIEPLTGTSEIALENGKIKAINFSFSDETLADLQAAPFVAREDLIGAWTVGTYLQLNEDGTARVALKVDDLDQPVSEEHPGSLQAWSYDGMVLRVEIVEVAGESTCTPGQVGYFFVKWSGKDLDRLSFDLISDECGDRAGGMMWGNWAPMSP